MAWKKGPLPPGTYNWGGVVPKDEAGKYGGGFYFADFRGDKVVMNPGSGPPWERTLTADEVGWYDNGLELAPTGKGRAGPGAGEERRPMHDVHISGGGT